MSTPTRKYEVQFGTDIGAPFVHIFHYNAQGAVLEAVHNHAGWDELGTYVVRCFDPDDCATNWRVIVGEDGVEVVHA